MPSSAQQGSRFVRTERDIEATERQSQAEPTRFDVGLLARPAAEKRCGLLRRRQFAELRHLARRKESFRNLFLRESRIDADFAADRYGLHSPSTRMRNIEADVGIAKRRLAVPVIRESNARGVHVQV